jgi:hypothetical protein
MIRALDMFRRSEIEKGAQALQEGAEAADGCRPSPPSHGRRGTLGPEFMGRAQELVDDAEGRFRRLSGGAMSSRQRSRELEEIERKVEEATRVQKLENARGS